MVHQQEGRCRQSREEGDLQQLGECFFLPKKPDCAASRAAACNTSVGPVSWAVAVCASRRSPPTPVHLVPASSPLAGGQSQLPEQPLPGFSAAALSRFFFVLGRTALQHLLCVETLGKSIRQARLAAGRAAAEAADRAREAAAAAAVGAAGGGGKGAGARRGGGKAAAAAAAAVAAQQADDVAGMLGSGAMSADAELDDLVELIEAQVGGTVTTSTPLPTHINVSG